MHRNFSIEKAKVKLLLQICNISSLIQTYSQCSLNPTNKYVCSNTAEYI